MYIILNVLNGLSNGLVKYKLLIDLFFEILGLIVKLLNFEDFSFIRRIFNFLILEKYNKVLGENLKKIVEGVIIDEILVNKFIDDFGFFKLLILKGIFD